MREFVIEAALALALPFSSRRSTIVDGRRVTLISAMEGASEGPSCAFVNNVVENCVCIVCCLLKKRVFKPKFSRETGRNEVW